MRNDVPSRETTLGDDLALEIMRELLSDSSYQSDFSYDGNADQKLAALSAAAVAHGREQAGLPPLPQS